MLCGQTTCGCAFQSESLQISNESGVVSIETNAFAIVTSSTRPSSPFTNQFIYETDTGLSYRFSGSAWQLFAWTNAPRCIVTNASQSIPHNDPTSRATFPTETSDPFGWHSAGLPTRITPTIPGYYQFVVEAQTSVTTADYNRFLIGPMKNGAPIALGRHDLIISSNVMCPLASTATTQLTMNGTTDYVEMQIYHTNSATAARPFEVRATLEWKANL